MGFLEGISENCDEIWPKSAKPNRLFDFGLAIHFIDLRRFASFCVAFRSDVTRNVTRRRTPVQSNSVDVDAGFSNLTDRRGGEPIDPLCRFTELCSRRTKQRKAPTPLLRRWPQWYPPTRGISVFGRSVDAMNPEDVYGKLFRADCQAQLFSHRNEKSGVTGRTRHVRSRNHQQ